MSEFDGRGRRRIAVALEYSGEGAPRVTAKGEDAVAETIMRLAGENGVPLKTDRDLVEVLGQMELNQEIPEALYRAVAEVIAFAYMVRGRVPEGFDPAAGGPATPPPADPDDEAGPPDPPPSG